MYLACLCLLGLREIPQPIQQDVQFLPQFRTADFIPANLTKDSSCTITQLTLKTPHLMNPTPPCPRCSVCGGNHLTINCAGILRVPLIPHPDNLPEPTRQAVHCSICGGDHFAINCNRINVQSSVRNQKLHASFRRLAEAWVYATNTFADFTASVLDRLTVEHTAFSSFSILVNAEGGYFPSIPYAPEHYNPGGIVTLTSRRKVTLEIYYAELDLLATAYNLAQEARNDPRRAYRS